MSFICMKTGSTPTAYRAHELPVFLSHERCMPIVERVLFSIDQTGIWTERLAVGI